VVEVVVDQLHLHQVMQVVEVELVVIELLLVVVVYQI
jgi:hypothetical protein